MKTIEKISLIINIVITVAVFFLVLAEPQNFQPVLFTLYYFASTLYFLVRFFEITEKTTEKK